MDDARITAAGAGNHVATKAEARTELLEAATAALRWFDLFDHHAPSDWVFGGEAEVRKQLRAAIRGARVEAVDRDWDDALDADEAEALDDLVAATGRAPTARERAAYLAGYRERKAHLLGRVRGWEPRPGSAGGQPGRGSTGPRPLFVRVHNDPAPLHVDPAHERRGP